MEVQEIESAVRHWVDSIVVGLNLCPFAKRELVKDRVRFCVSEVESEEQLLATIESELQLLDRDNGIETTLLIHPNVLQHFFDFNQFLNYTDALLIESEYEGIYQIASFHPDYQFGGTEPDDVENYTNRSPYPVLHLIREESLERAVANYPNAEKIPEHNVELMEKMGSERLAAMLQVCFEQAVKTNTV